MSKILLILTYLLLCQTPIVLAQGYSSTEIRATLEARIGALKTKVTTAKELSTLDYIEISEYNELKLYYDSYVNYLEETDKIYCAELVKNSKQSLDNQRIALQRTHQKKAIQIQIETLTKSVETAQTLSEGKLLQYELDQLKDALKKITKNRSSFSTAWMHTIQGQVKELTTKVNHKRRKLSENIALETNTCKTIPLDWVITKKQFKIEGTPSKTDKSIARITNILKEENILNSQKRTNKKPTCRQKKLTQKLEKLQLQAAIERAENTEVIDTEPLAVHITFCQKKRLPKAEKELMTYWGISEMTLPQNRQTDNHSGLSYTFSSEITSNGFSDVATIKTILVREKTDDLPREQTTIKMVFIITTNPETHAVDLDIQANPDDEKALEKLGYKTTKIPDTSVYFDSNWKEKKSDYIEKAEKQLSIK